MAFMTKLMKNNIQPYTVIWEKPIIVIENNAKNLTN